METWAKITAVLCVFGIFKEIRPSEPFLTEYLEGPWFNFTESQVNHQVYPIWTYSYLVWLFIILMITDYVRYKPVIILEAFAYIVTWCLLLWGHSLFAMQMMQAVYGVATATEVAYYTYIYSVVTESVFQKVTSYSRGALLFGQFVSGLISQVLISTGIADFHSLNYVSFVSVSICFLISFALPRPDRALFFMRANVSEDDDKCCSASGYLNSLRFMAKELRKCYTNRNLLLWSIWWAVATSGNIQIGNYIQPLWETISQTWGNSTTNPYNGAVEATHTLLSSGAAIGLGYVQEHYLQLNEVVLAIPTFISFALLLIMARTTYIWVAYVTYVGFKLLYQVVITVVSFHVAKCITPDTYGLIFGTNTFVALVLQTLMTLILVDHNGLSLDTRTQFTVYGSYFGLLGLLFVVLGAVRLCSKGGTATPNVPESVNIQKQETEVA